MREALVWSIGFAAIAALACGMRWLAPYLDRWGERIEAEETERRRPKGPRPPILPPTQYPKITPEQRRQFEQNFNESLCRIAADRPWGVLGMNVTFQPFPPMPNYRIEPDIEDEP